MTIVLRAALVALVALTLVSAAGVRAAGEDDGVTQFYARAVKVMDGLPQPPYVTYRLDVVVNADSLRLCMMRYGVAGAFGFHGIVEQHYADVGGYWMQTDGLLDGTLRAFGISTHHGIWRYRLLDMAFPTSLPPDAFTANLSFER